MSTPIRPRPRRRILAAALAAALPLAGCGPAAPLVEDPYTRLIAEAQGDVPLPPGARYESAADAPARPAETPGDAATPPPDAAEPAQRVPGIVARGRLIIGVDSSLNLLGYRDGAGRLTGFEVELAREVARDIFGDPDAVDFRYVDSAERIRMLAEGRVDAVIRTMTVTGERTRRVSFSAPYLTAAAGLLTTRGSGIAGVGDLADRRVCVAGGTTSEDTARQIAPESTLLLVANWGDCLVALQQHQADALLADDFILAGIRAQDPGTVIVGERLSTEDYAVAVPLGDTGLQRQINATLERIRRDGTWRRLYDESLGRYLDSADPPAPRYAEPEEDPDAPAGDGAGPGGDDPGEEEGA